MADCRKCKHNYKMPGDEPRCNRMCDGELDFEPITNAMKIRSMNDEELAEFIENNDVNCARFCPDFKAGCLSTCKHNQGKNFILNWLQSEAE